LRPAAASIDGGRCGPRSAAKLVPTLIARIVITAGAGAGHRGHASNLKVWRNDNLILTMPQKSD
jgi:hypothetical protein